MAAAGTAGYLNDLAEAIRFLRKELGDHVLYGPLPNIMLNGTEDEATLRTNLEVGAWAKATGAAAAGRRPWIASQHWNNNSGEGGRGAGKPIIGPAPPPNSPMQQPEDDDLGKRRLGRVLHQGETADRER
jgi:hypothetical protein